LLTGDKKQNDKVRENSESKNTVKVEVQAKEKALAKEAESILAKEKARKREDAQRIQAEESTKLKSQEENEAKEEESIQAKKEQLHALAKAREEGKAEALSEAKIKAATNDHHKKNKDKKKKHFEKKLDEEVKKRLSKMALCNPKGGKNGTDDNSTNVLGGTNVFDGKINATDALGIVGFTNYSINKPPYVVKRCDQILLIHGKKLDLLDYCIKDDAFMTMSIYMVNFFLKKDSNNLLDSYNMNDITAIPSALPGAPGCTMWQTKTKSFPFCYESVEILDQVTKAYYEFLHCRKPSGPRIAYAFKNACDLSKMDLSTDGPFGQQGPLYKEIIDAMNPDVKKKEDLTGINPYYITEDNARIPGNYIERPPVKSSKIK
jgi:hypothetical protein